MHDEVLGGIGVARAEVVVNATEYSDLETVALGALQAERAGKSFLYRAGPSFVRSLAGIEPRAPLRGDVLWPDGRPGQHFAMKCRAAHTVDGFPLLTGPTRPDFDRTGQGSDPGTTANPLRANAD